MSPLRTLVPALVALAAFTSLPAAPLRVLVSSDSDSFARDYAALLKSGGATVTSAAEPTAAALATADVVLLHRSAFTPLPEAAQAAIRSFTGGGGGIVAVHGAIAGGGTDWGLATLGGGWNADESRRVRTTMMLYVVADSHPIVRNASPFDLDDDTVYDLALADDIEVLASAYTPKGRQDGRRRPSPQDDVRISIYDLQPQMWTHEGDQHRAAVLLQGAGESTAHNSIRGFLLRSIAWAGNRDVHDEFCSRELLENLRYPEGGPRRAEDAIAQFRMQPGFKAEVVAAEPLITKPIAIQWDGDGRLWVAETPEYPNGRRPLVAPAWKETGVLDPGHYDRPARDTISILEDTDGDGVADGKRIFHEGLELVTGFCFHKDGVIAVAQPSIVWLRDTDGDSRADEEVPLYDGFTPGDTHFVANHFMHGPDGWIYASTGSGAVVRKPGSDETMARLSPGMFRFRPDGSAIEQVASQGGNSFGGELTSDFELFHGKATSGHPIQHVVLPEWVLARAPDAGVGAFNSVNPGRQVQRKDLPTRAPIMQIDQVGRYSAACSSMVYEGGAWPEEYEGKVFVTEPILDIIHHEAMRPDGPSYRGEMVLEDEEWLRSDDYWFCPIDIALGPDGAAYVLDFYTPVVAHNDTRGPQHSRSNASVRPDRDHYFGRIYRIQHGDAPETGTLELSKAGGRALVEAFRHGNRVVRMNAQRLLLEQPELVDDALLLQLEKLAGQDGPSPSARVLALWSLQGLGKLKPELLGRCMRSSRSPVRKNAMLIAEAAGTRLTAEQARSGLADSDVRVRLATLRALAASDLDEGAAAALLDAKFDDPWSRAAAVAAGARQASSQLETLLTAADSTQDPEAVRALAASLASSGDAGQLPGILRAAGESPHPELAVVVLRELSANPPRRPRNARALREALGSLLVSENQQLAAAALPLAIRWDRRGSLRADAHNLVQILLQWLEDPARPEADRIAAVRSLVASRRFDERILPRVIATLDQPVSDALAVEVVGALAATGDAPAGEALVRRYPSFEGRRREAAFDAIVSRPEWAGVLLDAIAEGEPAPAAFEPAEKARLTRHPDAGVAKRATATFGGGGAKDQLVAELLPEMRKPGDPDQGKRMFAAACATCHQLEGEGHEFGPALDGIGSHPVLELLTHIVNPNLIVDDEHRTWNITMKDGTQYSALIASENESRVQLQLPAGVTIDLRPSEIAKREKADHSLMPEGLEALGTESLRDIITYLRACAPQPGAADESR